MSLTQRNLSALQKAGQAVHSAAEAIAVTVRDQAESLVASVASNPLVVDAQQAFSQFATLARLSQDLSAIELQLQGLYATANELARPEAAPKALKRAQGKPRPIANAPKAKPIKKQKKSAVKTRKANESGAITATANDNKLMQYLQATLKADEWTAISGADMSKGAELPMGSVGASLKKLLAMQAVKRGVRGTYQLPG